MRRSLLSRATPVGPFKQPSVASPLSTSHPYSVHKFSPPARATLQSFAALLRSWTARFDRAKLVPNSPNAVHRCGQARTPLAPVPRAERAVVALGVVDEFDQELVRPQTRTDFLQSGRSDNELNCG